MAKAHKQEQAVAALRLSKAKKSQKMFVKIAFGNCC
jgi:hypothetical protein